MLMQDVRVHPSKNKPSPARINSPGRSPRSPADKVRVPADVAGMIINRIIDNAAVALASVNRSAPVSARGMALGHPRKRRRHRSSAWRRARRSARNGRPGRMARRCASSTCTTPFSLRITATRATTSRRSSLSRRPMDCSGADLIRGLATGYEIQIDLVRAICLHAHKIDHIAHLCPAQAAGIGTLLGLKTDVIYQAVQQAVHVSFTTRQSRKGEISSWKAFAPAHSGKLAIEAVDRAMRGEGAPSPIYEGEDSVIAWMLDGPASRTTTVPLPGPKEAQARHHGQLHQGAFGGVSEPGADRPRLPHARCRGRPVARSSGSSSTPATTPIT